MPLDTSSYSLALLRVDGRRWNELRRCHAQIRTQAAADGSSYLEMGNTKVMCVVTGPTDQQSARRAGGGGGGGGQRSEQDKEAEVAVSIVIAGFSSVDRKRRGRGDKYVLSSLQSPTTGHCPKESKIFGNQVKTRLTRRNAPPTDESPKCN